MQIMLILKITDTVIPFAVAKSLPETFVH